MACIHICHLSFIVLYFYGLSTGHYRDDYLKTVELFSFILYKFSGFLQSCKMKMCRLMHELWVIARNFHFRNQHFSSRISSSKRCFQQQALGSIHCMWTFILSHYPAFEDLERDFCIFTYDFTSWIIKWFSLHQHKKPPLYSKEKFKPKFVASENLSLEERGLLPVYCCCEKAGQTLNSRYMGAVSTKIYKCASRHNLALLIKL